QDVGVGEPQGHDTPEPRHRGVIPEPRVADAADPLVVVVDGVVHAVRAVERHVDDRDAQVVEEHRVIRPAPEPLVHELGPARIRPITVWISRVFESIATRSRTRAGPAPARYATSRPPRQETGVSAPPSASRITRASRHDSGTLTIFGTEIASAIGIRRAPGTDAHPGVSGSPGTRKSKGIPPRWMWLSGPQGPSGYVFPFLKPSSAGSE